MIIHALAATSLLREKINQINCTGSDVEHFTSQVIVLEFQFVALDRGCSPIPARTYGEVDRLLALVYVEHVAYQD